MENTIHLTELPGPRWRLPGYKRIFVRSLFFTGLFWLIAILILFKLKLLADPTALSNTEVVTASIVACGGGLLVRIIGEFACRQLYLFDTGLRLEWASIRRSFSSYSRFTKAQLRLSIDPRGEMLVLKLYGKKQKHDISLVLASRAVAAEVFTYLKNNTPLEVEDITEAHVLTSIHEESI